MTAQLSSIPDLKVQAGDGIVHIRDLASADPDLLALVNGATDREAVVQRVLSTGARALVVAQVSVDTAVVEASFGALESQLRMMLENTTARVADTTTGLLDDPERGICATLGSWKEEVSSLLEQTFDPKHSDSAVSKLDLILRDASERQLSATRRLLNPDFDDSPLSRLMTGVRDQVATVLDAVARLAEQIAMDKAATKAAAAALERSAVKGMVFEEQVVVAVTAIAAECSDVAEAVGCLEGVGGGRVGDIVVEVDPVSNGGRSGTYVLECKDRRLSLKATMDELRRAADNRDASAAIAVFSKAENAPVPAPFAVFNDRAIVVYDKEQGDATALRLACAWARWIVQRESRTTDANVDLERIGRLLDDTRRALERVNSIKRAHSAAAKRISEASLHVSELSAEVTQTLDQIEHALTTKSSA